MRLAGINQRSLEDLLARGGVPLQQALTSMLAESGEFIRREQDWKGVPVEFKQAVENAEQERESADLYSGYMRDLMHLATLVNNAAQSEVNAENQTRPQEVHVDFTPMTFGSRLFNLSSQYLLALRSDGIVKESLEAIARGDKPFIALYNTMEGPITDLAAMGLPLNFNGILLREMRKMLTVKIRDPLAQAHHGNQAGERTIKINPEDMRDGGAFFHRLEAQILNTDLGAMPISPIDYIKRK